MSVVTEISVVAPPPPPEPPGAAGAVQVLPSADGRPAVTLVSAAPPSRR